MCFDVLQNTHNDHLHAINPKLTPVQFNTLFLHTAAAYIHVTHF